MSVCEGDGGWGRIQGIFLAVDGQLNAPLVKTAVQNVPHARGRQRSHMHTHKHKDTCVHSKIEVQSCRFIY